MAATRRAEGEVGRRIEVFEGLEECEGCGALGGRRRHGGVQGVVDERYGDAQRQTIRKLSWRVRFECGVSSI